MLPFILYLVTAIVTGVHLWSLLSFALYGAPFNLLELISLLGSFSLLLAAYISLFRPHAGARLALIACLVMWCFYAPAIAKLVRKKFAGPAAVSQCVSPPLGAATKDLFIST